MIVYLAVRCEAKDEYSGGEGRLPEPGEVAPVLQDILADVARGDFAMPWMVRRVDEVTS